MKKLRRRATLDEVKTAIAALKKQGIKPTADNIIAEIIQSSNGTVGIAKGTVLKFRRALESLDNSLVLGSVKETKSVQFKTTKSTQTKPKSLDESLLNILESKLKVQLETYLDDRLREQLAVYQVNQANEQLPDEALQEMHELWLDSVTRYISVPAQSKDQVTELKRQVNDLQEINEKLESENQELKAQLDTDQLNFPTQPEVDALLLENEALKSKLVELEPTNQSKDQEIVELQSTLSSATNSIEVQQTQLNPLDQDLYELRELWLEAVFQIMIPSASVSTITETTETDLLETYFQTLSQLHNLSPGQKYDCAMKLFERGLGPSDASRILSVNKGSLQHYKEGKRKRPDSD